MAEKDTRTPEEIQAAKDKMAKVRAARGQTAPVAAPPTDPTPTEDGFIKVPAHSFQQLLDEVKQLKEEPKETPEEAMARFIQMVSGGAKVGKSGVMGSEELASTNPNDYEDPTERLFDFCDHDPRLSRFNVRQNYRIVWVVEADSYKKDGISYRYPRFRCELLKLLFNEDGTPMTRETKDGRTVQRAAFKGRSLQKAEDEIDVRTAMRKLNMNEEGLDSDQVLDEFRFYRLKEWLSEKILPHTPIEFENDREERVIDGELVEIHEYEVKPKTSVFGG